MAWIFLISLTLNLKTAFEHYELSQSTVTLIFSPTVKVSRSSVTRELLFVLPMPKKPPTFELRLD